MFLNAIGYHRHHCILLWTA